MIEVIERKMKSTFFKKEVNVDNYRRGMYRPTQVYISKWGQKRYFRGGKVVIPKNITEKLFVDLIAPLAAENKQPKVFFAGEVYDRESFGFLNGAINSAENVSHFVMSALKQV